MEKKSVLIFKIISTIMFAVIVFGLPFILIKYGNLQIDSNIIGFGCTTCACFLFSLIFIRKDSKKLLITLALAINVVADSFLTFMPFEKYELIAICVFCGMQFVYFVYTLFLNKGTGTRIVNIAVRVALCLTAYFVLRIYVPLTTLDIIYIMYILNSFITLLVFLVHLKTDWLTFIGFLFFFIYDVFSWLLTGGIALFGLTGSFVDFLNQYAWVLVYCNYIGMFIISASSVWAKKKEI